MTRINCVPPEELVDKHLLAEYRELPRVFKLARLGDDIPVTYRMGKGHVKFFYNKLAYLLLRQHDIVREMKVRGFNPKYDPNDLQDLHTYENDMCWGTWTPTPEAIEINRQRIQERMPKMRGSNEATNI